MPRWLAVWLVAAVACGGSAGLSDATSLREVVRDPERFDGDAVTMTASYYGSFEVSALSTGFAESDPPQPVEPLVWVDAVPPEGCTERSRDATWAESVIAAGRFEYDPDAGFGHLGAYDMALQDATLTCP